MWDTVNDISFARTKNNSFRKLLEMPMSCIKPDMHRLLLHLLALTLFSTTLGFSQVITTTTSDPASISLENLFAQADLVAFVGIRSGDAETYKVAVYKAVVLKSYKGSKVDDAIYFTPFVGYSIGNEYLVFLKKGDKQIGDIIDKDVKKAILPYDPTQSFYKIMYEGYSVMPVSYECAFEKPQHESCGYAVKFNVEQVPLPVKLKTYPDDGSEVDFSDSVKYVKRKSIEPILESLARGVR